MTEDLTDVEQRLVHAVEIGDTLDLRPDPSAPDLPMDEWGEERTIRADLIRDLLLLRHAKSYDPHGLQLRGALIAGWLDLQNVHSPMEIALLTCAISGGITLGNADLPSITLAGSTIGTTEPPIGAFDATGLTVHGDLRFAVDPDTNARVILHDVVFLGGSRISGQLSLSGAQLNGQDPGGNSLVGDGLHVGGGAFLSVDQRTGQPFTAAGAVRLPGTQIAGTLDLSGARLEYQDGDSLIGSRLHVDGNMFLGVDRATGQQPFTAAGAVGLDEAQVSGRLSMSGAQLQGQRADGTSLGGDGLQVDGSTFLGVHRATGQPFTATGAVRLQGARIRGQLAMSGAQLNGKDVGGYSLVGSGLQVDNGAFLNVDEPSGLAFTAAGLIGLVGARITGQLSMSGAQLNGKDVGGNSLAGDGLQVDGDMFLHLQERSELPFTAAGLVRLLGARITGQLAMLGAQLNGKDEGGYSLVGDGLQVDGDMFLRLHERSEEQPFTAAGAVRLRGARIIGTLYGPKGAAKEDTLSLTWELTDATIGNLWLSPRSVQRIDLAGCTYRSLYSAESVGDWLDLIRHHTSGYHPQPYQQLAAVQRAAGHEYNARRILIAQQDDRRDRLLAAPARATTRVRARLWWRRFGLRLQRLTIGYGYRARRAFFGALVALAAACVVGLAAGHTKTHSPNGYAAYRPPPNPLSRPTACSTVEQIGLGLRPGLPFLSTVTAGQCIFDTSTTAGSVYAVADWALQAIAWAGAALAIAGYTGLVRRS